MGLKESILSICQKLATIPVTTHDGLASTLYVRIWNDQIERKKNGEGYVYQTPACFVEVTVTESETLGQGATGHDLTIRFLLEQNNYNTEGSYDEDLDIFALRDKVHQTINGFKPANCSPLVIGAPALDYNHDNTYLCALEYRTHFTDLTASIHDELAGVYVWQTLDEDAWNLILETDLQPDKVGEAPAFVTSPSLTAHAVVGEAVTCSTGSYSGTAPVTIAYQWFVGATEVGDDSASYTPVSGDYGEDLTCRVTLTNGFGTVNETSDAEVVHSAPVLATSPSITVPGGDAVIGATLTVVAGTYTGDTPITKTYQWLRNGVAIDGATATTYKLILADLAASITCREFAVNAYGDTYADTSAVTALSKPILSVAPEISVSPDATVGNVFSSTAGTWTGTTPITISYQWQRNGADIVGATSSTYTGVLADADAMLSCLVSAANAIDTTQASTSSLYVFTVEYKAYINECIAQGYTIQSVPIQQIENKGVALALLNGAWVASDAVYFTKGDGDINTKRVNLKNPTGTKGTWSGSYTMKNLYGVKGDALTAYFRTNINMNTLTKYAIGNCSVFAYTDGSGVLESNGNSMLWGASDGTNQSLLYVSIAGFDWQAKIQSGTDRDSNIRTKTANHYGVEYNGANVVVRVDSEVYSVAQTGTPSRPNYDMGWLCRNKATPDQFSGATIAFCGFGDSTASSLWKAVFDVISPLMQPAITPATLLAQLDFNDTSKLWQDVAKTIPATATNDPIRVIVPSSGVWTAVTAVSDSERPLLSLSDVNGKSVAVFNGTTSNLDFPSAITTDFTAIFVVKNDDTALGSHLLSGSNYMGITGSAYPPNSGRGGEYIFGHPSSGHFGDGLKLKNQSNAYNAFAIGVNSTIWTIMNGNGVVTRFTNSASFSFSKNGQEYLTNWRFFGKEAVLYLYSGNYTDREREQLIYSLNTLYNI